MAKAGSEWRYYQYDPSYVLAYVAIALFAVAFVAQCGLLYWRKSYYMIPFLIGCLGESVGYGFRRVSADHPTGRGAGLTWYILQELFIILCPALFCASYYMCFGRILTYVGERWSPVSSKWVTAIFVTVDIVSFVVQGAGGSLYSSDNTNLYSTAKAILLVGFSIQIIGLGIFCFFALVYHARALRAGIPRGAWTTCLYTLYAGSVCVLVRGIFRCIEFGTGQGGGRGYLLEREAWYYGLETLPILLASYLLSLSYPGHYIPHARGARLFPSDEAEVEVDEPVEGGSVEKLGEGGVVGEEEKGRRWWRRELPQVILTVTLHLAKTILSALLAQSAFDAPQHLSTHPSTPLLRLLTFLTLFSAPFLLALVLATMVTLAWEGAAGERKTRAALGVLAVGSLAGLAAQGVATFKLVFANSLEGSSLGSAFVVRILGLTGGFTSWLVLLLTSVGLAARLTPRRRFLLLLLLAPLIASSTTATLFWLFAHTSGPFGEGNDRLAALALGGADSAWLWALALPVGDVAPVRLLPPQASSASYALLIALRTAQLTLLAALLLAPLRLLDLLNPPSPPLPSFAVLSSPFSPPPPSDQPLPAAPTLPRLSRLGSAFTEVLRRPESLGACPYPELDRAGSRERKGTDESFASGSGGGSFDPDQSSEASHAPSASTLGGSTEALLPVFHPPQLAPHAPLRPAPEAPAPAPGRAGAEGVEALSRWSSSSTGGAGGGGRVSRSRSVATAGTGGAGGAAWRGLCRMLGYAQPGEEAPPAPPAAAMRTSPPAPAPVRSATSGARSAAGDGNGTEGSSVAQAVRFHTPSVAVPPPLPLPLPPPPAGPPLLPGSGSPGFGSLGPTPQVLRLGLAESVGRARAEEERQGAGGGEVPYLTQERARERWVAGEQAGAGAGSGAGGEGLSRQASGASSVSVYSTATARGGSLRSRPASLSLGLNRGTSGSSRTATGRTKQPTGAIVFPPQFLPSPGLGPYDGVAPATPSAVVGVAVQSPPGSGMLPYLMGTRGSA
ncbi:hypothetical protein JCM10207_005888 [Rhodosporidiobolus poonsookiae]